MTELQKIPIASKRIMHGYLTQPCIRSLLYSNEAG